MSEHLALRSSVGSRSSALPSHHHHHLPNPDPLASVWIRRIHLIPNPPPPPRPPPPPPLPHSPGFGPFHWSMRPLRGAPVSAWDSTAAPGSASGGGGGQPMLSPFFRLPAPPPVTPVTDTRETTPVSSMIRLGSSSSGGYTGPSTRMLGGGDHQSPWLAARGAGAAYPSHALDMVPIRTLNYEWSRQQQKKQQSLLVPNLGVG